MAVQIALGDTQGSLTSIEFYAQNLAPDDLITPTAGPAAPAEALNLQTPYLLISAGPPHSILSPPSTAFPSGTPQPPFVDLTLCNESDLTLRAADISHTMKESNNIYNFAQ